MFPDNTLTPKEAVHLCALGAVAGGPMRYSRLAGEVRQFCTGIIGPTFGLIGTSLELLRQEGFLEAEGKDEDPSLRITEAGRAEWRALMLARLRPASDLSNLILALRLRFLPLLTAPDRAACIERMREAAMAERAALDALRSSALGQDGLLPLWLDHERGRLDQRIAWLDGVREAVLSPSQ